MRFRQPVELFVLPERVVGVEADHGEGAGVHARLSVVTRRWQNSAFVRQWRGLGRKPESRCCRLGLAGEISISRHTNAARGAASMLGNRTGTGARQYVRLGRSRGSLAVLGQPFPHHGDLAFLGLDHLFGEFADFRILAVLQLDPGHVDRPLVMGDHAADEIDIGIAGIFDRHVVVHLAVGLGEGDAGRTLVADRLAHVHGCRVAFVAGAVLGGRGSGEKNGGCGEECFDKHGCSFVFEAEFRFRRQAPFVRNRCRQTRGGGSSGAAGREEKATVTDGASAARGGLPDAAILKSAGKVRQAAQCGMRSVLPGCGQSASA